MADADPLLSELCSICHVNVPKYRCPRCSTRTCSLPCTRRHKLWSQCSGVRDPAAYLRRSELATESAFDRDFNFITGIERALERGERDAENRGIDLARGRTMENDEAEDSTDPAVGQKRKHPGQGLVKGEAGFLRGAEAGGVKVIRAPKGMTRNKQNASRWHPKHKCLSWSIEWISSTGEKSVRNSLETYTLSDAYDRAFSLPRSEKVARDTTKQEDAKEESASTAQDSSDTATNAATTATTETTETTSSTTIPSEDKQPAEEPEPSSDLPITSHRDLYFYLHRPRTTTKKPVLVPLQPSAKLVDALRGHTVLEFPTIYTLPDSSQRLLAEKETSPFILEEEYLRTIGPDDAAEKSAESEGSAEEVSGIPGSGVDLENVDESKILEVLKQDLFEPAA
ncbi:hypothetical protein N7492_006168 [Penicillium capsulatum]|uniref:Box C/D snoRNA protein 1 n=1 Tax=Penicillium capsulatum TaxID=69766 RepID=A0A9W9I6F0_9EURO|nr:hypothetical protein N7492_006168 [Penicillium capsulatum]KAJ6108819.1 hypothetical protein N7512_008656 [Penicillium capsulatum]